MREDVIARNLDVVHTHITTEAMDVDGVLDLYTDDVVWESPARGLKFTGKEAVARNYRATFASFADVEVQPLARFGNETQVFDDAIVTFTLVGEGFANSPVPLGTRVALRLLHVFDMRDGKIAREQVFEIWPVQGVA